MTEQINVTQARRSLATLADKVAEGERYLITRRGHAVAALVSVEDLRGLAGTERLSPEPSGALALVGLWAGVPDAKIDELVRRVRPGPIDDGDADVVMPEDG
ncbi:MAG: type II toxin-antitoxin system Phd/YefM family antitoxin [Dehalococcoidia bacterium]